MAAPEGRLTLELQWDGVRVVGAGVRSSRPLQPARILEGRDDAAALDAVPRLFSVCARAQTLAAATALEAARARPAPPAVRREREALLALEGVHEHLWRLLVDLPPLLGQAPLTAAFVAWRRLADAAARARLPAAARGEPPDEPAPWAELAEALHDLLAGPLLAADPAAWAAPHEHGGARPWLALQAWRRAGQGAAASWCDGLAAIEVGRATVPRLALPDATTLVGRLAPALFADAAWALAPTLDGQCAEPGSLARQAGQPLVAAALAERGATPMVRLLARLVELVALAARLRACAEGRDPLVPWQRGAALGGGRGIAAVETARGLLVHALAVDATSIVQWRTVAPTEWAFHPRGAWVKGLLGFVAADENRTAQAARLLAHALDPCVAYDLTIRHA